MNVLLLYPEFPDTFWSFKHALKFVRKQASLPPLGLLTVAALLPAEWQKRLVDVNVRPLTADDLDWAELVLVGGMIAQRDSARELIARCRAAGKTVVAGGPLFTAEHEQFTDVDHFVLNEAEATLPEFLRDFERGCARRLYTSTEFPGLWQTPAPLWELADLRAFVHSSLRLGVFGRERFHYWQLLLWTLCRRPATFQLAVTLAIYGHHFRKTCEALGL